MGFFGGRGVCQNAIFGPKKSHLERSEPKKMKKTEYPKGGHSEGEIHTRKNFPAIFGHFFLLQEKVFNQ